MAKKVAQLVKVQVTGGQANPAPPLGPVLGGAGIAIMDFCTAFNEGTKDRQGEIVPVVITIYEDRSFDFITKTAPAAELLKKAAGIDKGSAQSNKDKVATISNAQLEEVAKTKMQDLNANDIEAAKKIIAGTARSMGIKVEK